MEQDASKIIWHECAHCGVVFQCVPPHALHSYETHPFGDPPEEFEHLCSPECCNTYLKHRLWSKDAHLDWQLDPVQGWCMVYLDGSLLMRKLLNSGDKAPKSIFEQPF